MKFEPASQERVYHIFFNEICRKLMGCQSPNIPHRCHLHQHRRVLFPHTATLMQCNWYNHGTEIVEYYCNFFSFFSFFSQFSSGPANRKRGKEINSSFASAAGSDPTVQAIAAKRGMRYVHGSQCQSSNKTLSSQIFKAWVYCALAKKIKSPTLTALL